MMEYFDVYDFNRNKLDKFIPAGKAFGKGEYHLVADACIVNSKHQFLVQKRHPSKSYCPNMWGLTGGSVSSGENSWQAMCREAMEEIGIELDVKNASLIEQTTDGQVHIDCWLVKQDINLGDIKIQESEVTEVCWMEIEALKKIIAEKQFMPTMVSAIEKSIKAVGL